MNFAKQDQNQHCELHWAYGLGIGNWDWEHTERSLRNGKWDDAIPIMLEPSQSQRSSDRYFLLEYVYLERSSCKMQEEKVAQNSVKYDKHYWFRLEFPMTWDSGYDYD